MSTRGKKNERGASAVEYGLMVAMVAAVFIGGLMALGAALGVIVNKCASPGIEKGYIDASAGESCG